MSNFLWVEKYRPKTIEECVLPDDLKKTFRAIVDTGEVRNMLFTGTAGLGKTTVAKAICESLGLDYIMINASESGNIDTLRGTIKQFATSVSLGGGYKVVILDEADYLNAQSFQPALRGFMEEFSEHCRFILTCNFKNKLIDPIHSRCSVYEFNVEKKKMPALCGKFMTRMLEIFEEEGIQKPDKIGMQTLATLISKHAPDWRRILSEAQGFCVTGEFVFNGSSRGSGENIDALFGLLKSREFKKMRVWVAENVDTDPTFIFRQIYDRMYEFVDPKSVPQLVLILADYSYKQAFVADQELNMVAAFTEIMSQVTFK